MTDRKSKTKIKDAFGKGAVAVNELKSSWAVMRSVSDDEQYTNLNAEHLMTVAENYAKWCKKTGDRSGVVNRKRSEADAMAEGF